MGSLSPEDQPRHIQDLKVTLHRSSLVFPSQQTQHRSMFLSNIDQVLNFNVQTVHFFPANPDFPPPSVSEKIRKALETILVSYDFMAGRLRMNPEEGRLEIECNGGGAGLVAASSEFELDELGDLIYPNPGFQHLIVTSLDSLPSGDQPLCIFQVTSFKCGGFAIGLCTNHATMDGIAVKVFLDNLASLAAGGPLVVPPCNDRRLLAARSPPQVSFPHPELLRLPTADGTTGISNPKVFEDSMEELDFKVFRLSSKQISSLKEMAKVSGATSRITSFNVVAAHVWRCRALSSPATSGSPDPNTTMMLYAVDIRGRMRPPLPLGYAGNAVLSGYAKAARENLGEAARVGDVVDMVAEGATRMTEEYARSVLDLGEVNKVCFPHGDFMLSSWWRLGFEEVEYPWGKPRYSCPVVCRRKDVILLFPEAMGRKGVHVLVALPSKEMLKFESLFHKMLLSPHTN